MSDKYPPVIVRGAPFTFRTLHPPDGRLNWKMLEEHTMDRIITVTLPAIRGFDHCEATTKEIIL